MGYFKFDKRIKNTNRFELDTSRSFYQKTGFKPNGAWYSFDNEWKDFVRYNIPEWLQKTDVELIVDEKRLLIIDSKESLQRFLDLYKDEGEFITRINWQLVASEYSGIEIHDYWKNFGDIRSDFDYLWLNGWDVSSGCIWDLTAITSYKKI